MIKKEAVPSLPLIPDADHLEKIRDRLMNKLVYEHKDLSEEAKKLFAKYINGTRDHIELLMTLLGQAQQAWLYQKKRGDRNRDIAKYWFSLYEDCSEKEDMMWLVYEEKNREDNQG